MQSEESKRWCQALPCPPLLPFPVLWRTEPEASEPGEMSQWFGNHGSSGVQPPFVPYSCPAARPAPAAQEELQEILPGSNPGTSSSSGLDAPNWECSKSWNTGITAARAAGPGGSEGAGRDRPSPRDCPCPEERGAPRGARPRPRCSHEPALTPQLKFFFLS